MKAEAYGYADDPANNEKPDELILLGYINRYGAQLTLNRTYLSAREIRAMTLAQNIIDTYQERQSASDWTSWAKDNPGKSAMLNEAMKLWQMQS